jgi:hypothetical protein
MYVVIGAGNRRALFAMIVTRLLSCSRRGLEEIVYEDPKKT